MPSKTYLEGMLSLGSQSRIPIVFHGAACLGRGVLFLTDSDNGLDLVNVVVAKLLPENHPVLRFPKFHPKD